MRQLRLRYPATCAVCSVSLARGAEAVWDKETKKAICLPCLGGDVPAAAGGEAGGSARAKADHLEERAVEQARKKWGDHAAAVAAKIAHDDPSIKAWAKGADGESRLATFIERELGGRVVALHDRIIPGARANIDHLFVAPSGVWIVDAKAYKGKLEKRDVGPFWREENKIYVGGRDRTSLANGLAIQLKAVRAALESDPAYEQIPIHPVLCFLESEWAPLARPFEVSGVTVLYPGALRARLIKDGPLLRTAIERAASRLAASLPPAR
jgi:hypothetical protein